MPELSLPDPQVGLSLERQPERNPDGPLDTQPGVDAGLSPEVTTSLETARRNSLSEVYGPEWEAAGERLDAAFARDGAAAYERLSRDPGAYGMVTVEGAERVTAGRVAGALWAREQVLAESRGEHLSESYRSTETWENVDSGSSGDGTLDIEPPRRLRPGESFHYSSDLVRAVPVGGLPGANSGLAGAFRPSHTPLTVSVGGAITLNNVRDNASGHRMAEINVNAHSEASTNGYGQIHNVCTGGRLVEVTRHGDGMTIPFTLRRDPRGVVIPDSEGGSQELGRATLTVPAGRTCRAEFDMVTNLPSRSVTLSMKTYTSGGFTPVGSNGRQ